MRKTEQRNPKTTHFSEMSSLDMVRIINEEKVLARELHGYDEYKKKVKYRIIPFIW